MNNSENDYHPALALTRKIVSNKTQFTPKNGTLLLLEDQMKDFSERRRHIAEMCEKYKADIGEFDYRYNCHSLRSQWLKLFQLAM